MSANSDHILKQALALPLEERAELVEQLLATFQSPADPHIDELWAGEADDRLHAYDRGELKAVPAEKVFDRIKQRQPKCR
ncbi:MAG TPA: addiction module protein [Pyrinomonadaceae bacterium]|nr:addiction module protein [Pyrinomonadaceae bacterium]